MRRLECTLRAAWRSLSLRSIHRRVAAQDYPSRTITIVVPLAAGTGMDIIARLYGEQLAQSLGKPVIVENKPGAGLIPATQAVLAAPADGHTLLVGAPPRCPTTRSLYQANALRSREGPGADLALSDFAVHPGAQSVAAGQNGARIHQIRQGAADSAELQLARRRRRAAFRRRGDEAALRPQSHPRSLSQQPAIDHGHRRRPHRNLPSPRPAPRWR